ncbi:MarR family winged helix-turn-helix transcriptional regulator [Pseudonocardia humida]|uniref:MarR family transcriptional regulator n=1 Tax=Pseudonocardia humida TaxID=2800819 RepID=A0ABT0ZZ02_9PSEU|nr:MarR family transcriptional regulator [Pseudonocardia humida]MCO1655966.1 MarR family transcriptional regulator [Pseudonocardia humida]
MASTGDDRPAPPVPPAPGAAFLLTQIGSQAAARFAERTAELDLTPPQVGLLRAVAVAPGRSQQALARHLGTPPSRLVALVDGLDERGLVERRRNPDDRRLHALHLTEAGHDLLRRIAEVGQAHNDEVCAALTEEERSTLTALLARIAADHDLTPGVHPGYRRL